MLPKKALIVVRVGDSAVFSRHIHALFGVQRHYGVVAYDCSTATLLEVVPQIRIVPTPLS